MALAKQYGKLDGLLTFVPTSTQNLAFVLHHPSEIYHADALVAPYTGGAA